MNQYSVSLIRVYSDDGKCDVDEILEILMQNPLISGLTVFRGIAGFGPHHQLHTMKLLDLSADLPLVIEFFHQSETVADIIQQVHQLIDKAHIVSWPVNLSY